MCLLRWKRLMRREIKKDLSAINRIHARLYVSSEELNYRYPGILWMLGSGYRVAQ